MPTWLWVLIAALGGAALAAFGPRLVRDLRDGNLLNRLGWNRGSDEHGFRAYAEHIVPGASVLVVLALLGSLLPGAHSSPSLISGGIVASAGPGGGGGGSGGGSGGGGATGGPGLATPGSAASGGPGSSSGIAGSGLPGGVGSGQTGVTASNNGGNTYQGVTANSVKFAFPYQANNCGGANPAQAASAAGLNAGNTQDMYLAGEEYLNTYALDGVFQLPAQYEAGVNPKNGFWGRHITHNFYDDGGYTCPQQAQAVANQAAVQDKVFGALKYGTDGVEQAEAQIFARNHLYFDGIQGTTPSIWSPLVPYVWDGHWGTGLDEMTAMGSLACRDFAGGVAPNYGDPVIAGQPRKFGLIYVDIPAVADAAQILVNEAAKCGIRPEVVKYDLDESKVESEAASEMGQFHQDKVTTIFNLVDFFNIAFFTQSASNQDYMPEWLNSSFLIQDEMDILHTEWDKRQVPHVTAVSVGAQADRPDFYKAQAAIVWNKVRPNEAEPENWPVMWDEFRLLGLSLAAAGPDLTPATIGQGLQAICTPCARSDSLAPLLEAYPGHPELFSDFTIVKYNPNKPDISSPPDQSGSRPTGYWDFPENGRRYQQSVYRPE